MVGEKRDAPSMGERLLSRKIIPDTVFSSTAIRAKITAKIICQKIGYPEEKICFLDKLYHAEAKDLLSHILQLQDRFESAMLVGHNPGMTDLAANKWNIPISNLPTCGILKYPSRHAPGMKSRSKQYILPASISPKTHP